MNGQKYHKNQRTRICYVGLLVSLRDVKTKILHACSLPPAISSVRFYTHHARYSKSTHRLRNSKAGGIISLFWNSSRLEIGSIILSIDPKWGSGGIAGKPDAKALRVEKHDRSNNYNQNNISIPPVAFSYLFGQSKRYNTILCSGFNR